MLDVFVYTKHLLLCSCFLSFEGSSGMCTRVIRVSVDSLGAIRQVWMSIDFQTVPSGSFTHCDNAWLLEGTINASYNRVDRHAFKHPTPALARKSRARVKQRILRPERPEEAVGEGRRNPIRLAVSGRVVDWAPAHAVLYPHRDGSDTLFVCRSTLSAPSIISSVFHFPQEQNPQEHNLRRHRISLGLDDADSRLRGSSFKVLAMILWIRPAQSRSRSMNRFVCTLLGTRT